MTEGILFGMGNPLLDISATVSLDILKKYDLKENDAILADEKHMGVYDELVKNYSVEYIPGGATQNAIKVAQWILQKKGACVFSGCIKNDQYGQILDASCTKIGVQTAYDYHEGEDGTGLCACLITGHNRSLVTNLGAACKFTEGHLDKPHIWGHINKARYYYISAFFITSCHAALMRVAKHSFDTNKTFTMNLGAPFLIEFFNKQLLEAIEYSDFVFGNETEALKLSEMCGFCSTDTTVIAEKLTALHFAKVGQQRTVVITQGADPIIVVHKGVTTLYPVVRLSNDEIVDTNGAGDAFVGGFLAMLVQGHSIENCVKTGQWASNVIIQRAGCTFPDQHAPELPTLI